MNYDRNFPMMFKKVTQEELNEMALERLERSSRSSWLAAPPARSDGSVASPARFCGHGPAVSGQILGNPHDFADIALWVPIGNATSTGNVPDLASPLRLVVLQGTG